MSVRTRSGRECLRALWLLGLTPPVTPDELTAAWRARMRQAHPDRHISSDARSEAAHVMTRALNDARAVVAGWIASGDAWPSRNGERVLRFDEPEPWPERPAGPEPSPICRFTGLRRGDQVTRWPYTGDPELVSGTARDPRDGQVWVDIAGGDSVRCERVRLAAFGCPVCGLCAGPRDARISVRPCPQCLVDLRRLEARPAEADRVRSGIEARSMAGRAVAADLEDGDLMHRAEERGRWAQQLKRAGQDDLQAALLAAFTRAFERWAEAS
jgi:hypothetical protein